MEQADVTPVHEAAAAGHVEAVQLLLQARCLQCDWDYCIGHCQGPAVCGGSKVLRVKGMLRTS